MPLNWITFVLPKCKVEKSEALQPRRLQITFRRKTIVTVVPCPGTLEIESEIFIFDIAFGSSTNQCRLIWNNGGRFHR